MPTHTTPLFLLQALEDPGSAKELAESDLIALRTVADWITTFAARPHKDLGRAGPVCPFVPEAMDRKTLWLASEHIDGRSVADVVQLIAGYPAPFLLVRSAVITDWKFFLDDENWLDRWAHRHGESAVTALAEELRRLPWRTRRD